MAEPKPLLNADIRKPLAGAGIGVPLAVILAWAWNGYFYVVIDPTKYPDLFMNEIVAGSFGLVIGAVVARCTKTTAEKNGHKEKANA